MSTSPPPRIATASARAGVANGVIAWGRVPAVVAERFNALGDLSRVTVADLSGATVIDRQPAPNGLPISRYHLAADRRSRVVPRSCWRSSSSSFSKRERGISASPDGSMRSAPIPAAQPTSGLLIKGAVFLAFVICGACRGSPASCFARFGNITVEMATAASSLAWSQLSLAGGGMSWRLGTVSGMPAR